MCGQLLEQQPSAASAEILAKARAEELAVLRRESESPDAPPDVLLRAAHVLAAEKDYDTSIALYRRALARQYVAPDWRLELARVLADAGKNDEAIREAETARRQRPNWDEAEKLLRDLRQQRR